MLVDRSAKRRRTQYCVGRKGNFCDGPCFNGGGSRIGRASETPCGDGRPTSHGSCLLEGQSQIYIYETTLPISNVLPTKSFCGTLDTPCDRVCLSVTDSDGGHLSDSARGLPLLISYSDAISGLPILPKYTLINLFYQFFF